MRMIRQKIKQTFQIGINSQFKFMKWNNKYILFERNEKKKINGFN